MAERGRPRSFDRPTAIKHAMELFWAKGYDNTSMSDLTEAIGINPPSLYAAFGSKRELFREAVKLYGESQGQSIAAHLSEAPSAREAVEGFLHSSAMALSRRGKPRGCLVALGALHSQETDTPVHELLQNCREQSALMLEERLRRGVSLKELPRGFDCRAAAMFYLSVQHGMSILARDGASRDTLLAVARNAMMAWGLQANADRL